MSAAKCPHCGGISGFGFLLVLRAHYIGVWSADDDMQTDAEREYTPKSVHCLDCNKMVKWDEAHGLNKPDDTGGSEQ